MIAEHKYYVFGIVELCMLSRSPSVHMWCTRHVSCMKSTTAWIYITMLSFSYKLVTSWSHESYDLAVRKHCCSFSAFEKGSSSHEKVYTIYLFPWLKLYLIHCIVYFTAKHNITMSAIIKPYILVLPGNEVCSFFFLFQKGAADYLLLQLNETEVEVAADTMNTPWTCGL